MSFARQIRSKAACRLLSMWQDRRGFAAVEFALMATTLMFVLMAATDLALAIYARAQVGNVARGGTEYAAINPNASSSQIAAAATSATTPMPRLSVTAAASSFCGCATASGITQQSCGTSCTAGGTTGTYVSVTATGNYTPIFATQWNKYLVNGLVNMTVTETTRTQ